MKHPLHLALLLLGTVSALYLENDAPHLESLKTETDLDQDPDGSGEQKGELALTEEVIQVEGDEVKTSGYQEAFEDEEAVESGPPPLEQNLLCPREEDTVQIQGDSGCKTCRYLLVQTPKTFSQAQNVCRRCYQGNLVSIHNYNFNYHVHCLASKINQAQIWIGGILRGWFLWKKFCWIDGSSWNFAYWALGQPGCSGGHCVTLCSKDGRWRRAPCHRQLPFVCSF
ncbi:proteoglycan 3 [Urocitellus parryii]|uniref:Proteoglycan 3, pro eosinophil major basic protein 2 n=1 Tax=Urocitellus parryii TaxID=9999 RepID=A0A8D2KBA0_UROPR|nr:proteoglycan 3 [Urocitellus parryii]